MGPAWGQPVLLLISSLNLPTCRALSDGLLPSGSGLRLLRLLPLTVVSVYSYFPSEHLYWVSRIVE